MFSGLKISFVRFVVLVAKSCLTLCDSMSCCPPGSSVHGISQAKILEWFATSFSKNLYFFFNEDKIGVKSSLGKVIASVGETFL